ncbi:MAG: CIA30 family protein [Nibricoccus sp.]
MKIHSLPIYFRFAFIGAFVLPAMACAATPALIDDFSAPAHTTGGMGRFIVDDKSLGSQSHATQHCADGVLAVEGELIPGRGVPAFVSVPLLLVSDGKPQDISAYAGVRLRLKVLKGPLSVQVSSADIQNFDYHAAVVAAKRGTYVEVRLPFGDFKRSWSEQVPLNTKNVTSVNLVAFAMEKTAFAYEIDEIGFY